MAVKLSTHAVEVLGGKAPDNIPAPNPATEPPDGLPPEPGPDGIVHRQMFSHVLGRQAAISWTPDGGTVWVDGTAYTRQEIGELMARRPDAETLRGIHNIKQTFEGTLH